MKYLKVWTNFRESLAELGDDEIGRLFLAMLSYAESGECPSSFPGNERFLWPAARNMIDMANEKAKILRENGSKGGIAKRDNQNAATSTNVYQTVANCSNLEESLAEKKRKEMKGNEKKSFIDDDDARAMQSDHNRVLNAAESAGFDRTDAVRAKLISLTADHGMEKILTAIDACVEHGATNLAYLQGVLKGAPRKEKGKVAAQQYEQRNYEGEQEAALKRMLERGTERGTG